MTSSQTLVAADKLTITVLVDDVSDLQSANSPQVTQQAANIMHNVGQKGFIDGACLCLATSGHSIGIEIETDGETKRLLFDSGPDRNVLRRNANLLNFPLDALDGIVLSHGHWDHSGGLIEPYAAGTKTSKGKAVPLYAHEEMFVRRALRLPNGYLVQFEDVPTMQELSEAGAELALDKQARTIQNGAAYISGAVPRITPYEVGFPGHLVWDPSSDDWVDDPLILDERWLAVHVKSKGIFVFSACSHAGIVNVMHHAKSVFPDVPLYGLMGGLHLSGPATEAAIDPTVADLGQFDLSMICAGHCTGGVATGKLRSAYGDAVFPLAVGQKYHV